jgi:hypothetical protein
MHSPCSSPVLSSSPTPHPVRTKSSAWLLMLAGFILCAGIPLLGQNPNPRQTLLQPEANRPPDKNALMRMGQQHQRASNFDAANALRQKEIDDETTKLLILASDLKLQMDRLGDKPISDRLMREAEVIESLAQDVQKKMTLTIKGS